MLDWVFPLAESLVSRENIFILVIVVLLVVFILVVSRLRAKNKTLVYYLNITRTVTKALANKQEIVAFNGKDDIIFATHPYLYGNKKEFVTSINARVKASSELKMICDMLTARKDFETILSGVASAIHSSKKLMSGVRIIDADDSSINDNVSVFSMQDISKYLDNGEKAAKNYEQLEIFLDTFPFGIFYVNNASLIIGANMTFANMLKVNRDKIIGEKISDFITDFNYNIPPQKATFVSIKPKFSPEFNAILIKSAVSSISSMQPWIVHKNERNPIKEEKKSFLDQDSFISSSIPSVISTTDGEIKEINPAFAAMIQDKITIEKDKVMQPGSNILDFIASDSEADIVSHLKKAFATKDIADPIEIKFHGGNIVSVAHISRIRNQPEDIVLIQLIDISGQKILEQQFIQSQKMQAVGQLAGGIAHDFNNLLTAMIGFCDLLLQRYTQTDPSYGDVIQIKQNATRAARLVKQLLAFSRQQALKPKVLSLTESLADLSSLLRRLIGSNIDFQVVHGRDIWPIKADNSQLEQVIINLAVNARDAMTCGGKLTIQTRNFFSDKDFKCIYDIAHKGDYVLLEVIDTGCGIDQGVVENIFEPFFSRKNEQAKKAGSGTGLGLSTVYGIVKQTGGFINVKSELGNGSNFQIYLPRYTGPEDITAVSKEVMHRDLSGNETVLLVEDEDAVRMFSARALREKGYRVLEATCAEEALSIAANKKFELLITDVVMPKMDGPTLNKKLRENIKDMKTIFISGYTEDTFRKDLDKDSKIHFLSKPFTLKDLATKVKDVLTSNE
ncbi:hybrid sensor histidine kinase/response regulator [Alphaproteobacteria bacterium]|nr:hybrid sensor histidine kinase/response regulator [Alphaproteobacteria bacterium]